eukprot:m.307116 g.307116  ORF g.307116 m.307116 type:complete len:255 (+) comp41917_c0_seq1:40-804(+)
MDRWRNRVALVTGASVGIGAAIAERLVRDGMIVYGCARNVTQIEENAKRLKEAPGKLHALKCDLVKEDEILAVFKRIKEETGGVDVCINNAGLSSGDNIIDGSTEGWRNTLDVNVLALCICSREAVKQMREKGVDDGHIINLSSMSGHRIPPIGSSFHFYSVSKFAVNAITECTRQELREIKSHIRATQISPGIVRTEFIGRAQGDLTKGEEYYKKQEQVLEGDDMAALVEYVLQAPPNVQIHDILVRPTTQVY